MQDGITSIHQLQAHSTTTILTRHSMPVEKPVKRTMGATNGASTFGNAVLHGLSGLGMPKSLAWARRGRSHIPMNVKATGIPKLSGGWLDGIRRRSQSG